MNPAPLLSLFSLLLFFAILFFGKGVRLYTDWLWYAELGYLGVFLTEVKARLMAGAAVGAASFAWIWLNVRIARSFRDLPRPFLEDDWLNFPRRHQLLQRMDRAFPQLLLAGAVLAGIGVSHWWTDLLAFRHAVPFGVADPVFGKDVAFYVFRLPLVERIYGLAPALLFFTLLATVFVYALQRDVQLGDERIFMTRPAQGHLAALLALFFLWKAAGYRLDMYELLRSAEGVVFGATYTDLKARLPALGALTATAVLAGLSLLAPVFSGGRRAWFAPAAFGGLWLVCAVLGWGLYPKFVQRFRVTPNEIALETPYIERNIEHTRRAYGLAGVVEKPFASTGDLRTADLMQNQATLANVRLWDQKPLLATFSQLQEIRTYYKFVSVDNDRYTINNRYRQVMLSVREMDHRSLPSRIWINEHLTYTHGYGLVMGPVNEVTGEGLPHLLVRDIPPKSEDELAVTRPEIYYGELANEYVIVNTLSKELDYPAGEQNVYSQYQGKGGVPLSGFLRKVAFGLRFGTLKMLLSRDVTAESRILFHREVRDRVRRIAPFLLYDRDPYPVLHEGRVVWVLDAYTWTDRYPYSQPIQGRLNYIRNSVKATVDAYDGTVTFYAADPADPLSRALDGMFPGLLKPLDAMPEGLRGHLRYPQDLFEVQAAIYTRYHMTNPQVFYNQEDLWTTPHEIVEGNEVDVEPYYTIMRLPGEAKEEYILMLPFTPRQKSNLIAWMAARSDAPHYGELIVYRFPKEKLIYGPMQIEARIDQDAQISQQFTLWGQRGVQVLRGNLIVIPVKDSLLYVEPVYLQAERGKIPELRRVVVAYEDRIVMRETLDEALRDIFSGWTPASAPSAPGAAPEAAPGLERLTREAWSVFQKGQESLRRGDLEAYGRSVKELESVLRRLKDE
jgi:uncharacterized protein